MIIKVLKNSFVSLEEAQQYFEERFGSAVWESATNENKEKALITATKRLNKLSFIGYKKDINQPLEFPRKLTQASYCSYKVPDVPQEVKDATCEEAISLLEYVSTNGEESLNDPTFSMQSFKLGDVSVTSANISSKETIIAAKKQILSDNANSLISKWTRKGFDFNQTIYKEVY